MLKINLCDVKAAMFDLSVELDDRMKMKTYTKDSKVILELNSQVYCNEDVSYSILVSYNTEKETVTDVTLIHKYPSPYDIGELAYDNKELREALFRRLQYLFKVDNIHFKVKLG